MLHGYKGIENKTLNIETVHTVCVHTVHTEFATWLLFVKNNNVAIKVSVFILSQSQRLRQFFEKNKKQNTEYKGIENRYTSLKTATLTYIKN